MTFYSLRLKLCQPLGRRLADFTQILQKPNIQETIQSYNLIILFI